MAIESISPATGQLLERFKEYGSQQVEQIIEQVHGAWPAWRKTPIDQRSEPMRALAAELRRDQERLACLMAEEMGKPLGEGRAEVDKCAWVCEHYAEQAGAYLAPQPVASDAGRSQVAFRSLGAILAVMPWNFPLWQVFRFAAPALMAGNVGLLKHASNVPRCALAIEQLFDRAGFPADVFRTLLIGSGQVDAVIAHPAVRAVTLTGSDLAGRKVAAQAGAMLKKSVLELGGSDPFIVLDDADLAEAAVQGARSRCINSGQSCIAAKRFIVLDQVYEKFLALLRQSMAALKVGDPLLETTQVGPMARGDLRDELHAQVQESVAAGADLVLGGRPLPEVGYYYPPTILAEVKPGMPAYDQELFGPVAAVIRVTDEAEALRVANDTPFGLGASIWSGDSERAEALAAEIEAGAVFVNGLVKSDPRLPFGGIKESGYGRELAEYGIREFVNIQTVWVR
ncbi:MAG: NAD-dependent succinate-semialdehyde dehydrogenase [Syntrophotaleaceae bacterium]